MRKYFSDIVREVTVKSPAGEETVRCLHSWRSGSLHVPMAVFYSKLILQKQNIYKITINSASVIIKYSQVHLQRAWVRKFTFASQFYRNISYQRGSALVQGPEKNNYLSGYRFPVESSSLSTEWSYSQSVWGDEENTRCDILINIKKIIIVIRVDQNGPSQENYSPPGSLNIHHQALELVEAEVSHPIDTKNHAALMRKPHLQHYLPHSLHYSHIDWAEWREQRKFNNVCLVLLLLSGRADEYPGVYHHHAP